MSSGLFSRHSHPPWWFPGIRGPAVLAGGPPTRSPRVGKLLVASVGLLRPYESHREASGGNVLPVGFSLHTTTGGVG